MGEQAQDSKGDDQLDAHAPLGKDIVDEAMERERHSALSSRQAVCITAQTDPPYKSEGRCDSRENCGAKNVL